MFKYAQTYTYIARGFELLNWTVFSLQHNAYLLHSIDTHCVDASAVHIRTHHALHKVCVKGVREEDAHNIAPPPPAALLTCWKVHGPTVMF